MSTVSISGDAGPICTGTATFMMLKPPKGVELHPVPHRRRGENPTPEIPGGKLRPDEKKILATADAAIADVRAHGGAFVQRFHQDRARGV